MPRSIHVHPDYRIDVATALERNGFLTQGDLAAHLEIALCTVSNFCRGVNVSIAKFEAICEALALDKKQIIQPKSVQNLVDPSLPLASTATDPIEFFAYDRAWVGRSTLISGLSDRLQKSCRLLFLTGMAGIGKTALAERLMIEFQDRSLLRENFDNQEQAIDFGSVAARLLEKCGQIVTPDDRQDVRQLTARLVHYLQNNRCLLAIDSLEEVLQGDEQEGWSQFKDEGFLLFFQQVLASDQCQSRIIVTSQELPVQLLEFGTRYQNFWFNQPLTGLSEAEQIALFEQTGLDASPTVEGSSYLLRIGRAYEGHPLALRVIVGEIGSRPFYGNVLAYWNRYGSEVEEVERAIAAAQAGERIGADDKWRLDRFTAALRRNVQKRLEQTFERLRHDAKYAYLLLCEASVYRCAVPEDWWLSHLDYWDCPIAVQQAALDGLKDRFLVEAVVEQDQYLLRQHNLIRSVSLSHLKKLDLLE
ncbi:AAA family ATPase [Microcoleus sp. FACHB-1515]|uniref:AAA family ATPase n=1 Tax=Cyanophyceae TaxID=3028117 RepID=UPI001687392A|nr:AAA family ATPase [Microcoleus sp. FACHB-1515]MBD2090628.1 AAA family ATPase [Microcoleus sp. FACHB-1515]